jgi:hypothetical protein
VSGVNVEVSGVPPEADQVSGKRNIEAETLIKFRDLKPALCYSLELIFHHA